MAKRDKQSEEEAAKTKGKAKKAKKRPEVQYHRKPNEMDADKWQIALRRQFAANNRFVVKKMTDETVYADYLVTNPENNNAYKVALRSADPGLNFCSCFDFKINQLGTCKHIEAVLLDVAKRSKKRRLKIPVQRDYSSIYVNYLDNRAICLRIGTEAEAELRELAAAYFDADKRLTSEGLANFELFWYNARQIAPSCRCYDDALERILELREQQRRSAKLAKMKVAERRRFLDGLVQVPLFHYQEEGVLFAYQYGRVVIGDEMGLGKTVQAIAGAELLRREHGIAKVLILAPTSLKYQWKTEIEKFTGQNDALVIEGNAISRRRCYHQEEPFYTIASYHAALYDWQFMSEGSYDLIILDEAQRIKNWRTKIAQAVRRIPSRYAIVLTGTPIENNLEELYGLAQFVDPFALGPRHRFFMRYQQTDDTGRVVGYRNLSEIRQLLSHCLIRRTKKEVLSQLPSRTDKNLVVPMTREQKILHSEYGDGVAKLVAKWKRMGFLDEQDRNLLLRFLNMMRMVCDSTYIIDQTTNHQTKIDELRYLVSDILEIEGEKVVIFSQWARMNNLVAEMLQELDVDYRYLHGDVPAKQRGDLFYDFNNDPEVRVFLSTDAGGVGLNLQAAAWLINIDIPWNPGVLEQRIGRIHRMGQTKPVNIINLIAQESIEHSLLGVLQFKKSMAAGVLDAGDDSIFLGDDKFRKFMESVEVITRGPQEPDLAVSPAEITDDDAAPDAAALPEPPVQPEELIEAEEDIMPGKPVAEPAQAVASTAGAGQSTSQELVQDGLRFLGRLAQTLSDREATEKLVESITEKDEKTGRTYVKLPVDDVDVVHQFFKALGGLMKGGRE